MCFLREKPKKYIFFKKILDPAAEARAIDSDGISRVGGGGGGEGGG